MAYKNYIDVKCTAWQRLYFKDEADMQEIVKTLEETDDVNSVISEEDGFVEASGLDDTSEYMSLQDNNNNATIEVFIGEDVVWDNQNGKYEEKDEQ